MKYQKYKEFIKNNIENGINEWIGNLSDFEIIDVVLVEGPMSQKVIIRIDIRYEFINLPRFKTMRYYKTEFDEFISKQREDKLKELGIENT